MPSFVYENKLISQGFKVVAGVDEAGRGPLAGPIVAAAVVFPNKCKLSGLDDSKKISPDKREKLFIKIFEKAIAVGIGILDHKIIDKINIGKANSLVMKMAIENLKLLPDFVLVDGKRSILEIDIEQRAIVGGDGKSASIAAASIIAKVTRDRMMVKYHAQFPQYGFIDHKGYGTKEHYKKIKKYGPCPIHRRTFNLLDTRKI
ncbi:MAG: ribonuclease HII [Candidatus Margulisiibacteriota bacterium]